MKLVYGIFCLILLTACQPRQDSQAEADAGEVADAAKITGTVAYRERILLLPGSRLEVTLEDVSLADAPAKQISRLELLDPGQVPIAFELDYDPSAIDSRMSYSLRAKIFSPDDRLLFINDTHTPVITRDAGTHADMMLVSAASKPVIAEKPALDQPPGMDLQGQFSYMADAALFRDCSNGKSFPVEMSGQYIELERTYLDSGIEAGSPLKVELRGRYLERPGMEENSLEVHLIVDEFHKIADNQDCTPDHHAELTNTYWKLLSLGDSQVQAAPNQREAHLLLNPNENRVNGNGGCNNFFGSYTLEGDRIEFSGMGSTMMACMSGMDTEQAFLLALNEADRVLVKGEFMHLFKGDNLLARFEAVYF